MRTKVVILLLLPFTVLFMQRVLFSEARGTVYHSPERVNKIVREMSTKSPLIDFEVLAKTPGNRKLTVLKLNAGAKKVPAILVIANPEGDYPIASEAALELVKSLTGKWKDALKNRRWYIVPVANPDGYANFFKRPLRFDPRNAKSFNDDKDDRTDEDGAEDLNGDGFVTQMRQKHPEGVWIPLEGNPVLMRKADRSKGEQGIYRLFTEGIDNDGDGKINEDSPGGVIPGRNFPHNFVHFTTTNGLWAASEIESRAILKFSFDHPEIATVIVFSKANTLKNIPTGRKMEADQEKYKVPRRLARRMGVDPGTEYPLKDLLEMAREYTGYKELTTDMLLTWLGTGAAVNPHRGDLPYWKGTSKQYSDLLKKAKLDAKRVKPPSSSSGSVEEWAYYQYGVPAFSIDFWTVPEPEKKKKGKSDGALSPEAIEKMSNEEFIALGKEKIEAMLKSFGRSRRMSADMLISALKSGRLSTKKMAGMMRRMAKTPDSDNKGADRKMLALYEFNKKAFLPWRSYRHPTLGEVEIGGAKPYSLLLPPEEKVEELIEKQLPAVRMLSGMLPELSIDKVEVKAVSSDVFRVEVWIRNNGFFPFPTHQGMRNRRPTPAWVIFGGKGINMLEGKHREVLGLLAGSGGFKKLSRLIRAKAGTKLKVKVDGLSVGSVEKSVVLQQGGE